MVPGATRIGGYYGRYSGRGGELKFFDAVLDQAGVPTGGSILDSMNLIGQGVTESTRIGRKCTIKSIFWRYQVALPVQDAVAVPITGDTFRVIMFVDKQANGATAAVLDILETANIHSFRNLANQNRFDILYDKLHNINYAAMGSDGAGVMSQGKLVHNYTFYKKCNVVLEFDNTTGAITEIRSNNIGLLRISATGICDLLSQYRIRFSDQ